eukprot:8067898-Pyramimonas_sp.AAC.1
MAHLIAVNRGASDNQPTRCLRNLNIAQLRLAGTRAPTDQDSSPRLPRQSMPEDWEAACCKTARAQELRPPAPGNPSPTGCWA